MSVQTRALARQSLARRAGLMLAVPALALTLALGGCHAGARNNGAPVSQSTSGSSSATNTSGTSGTGNNAALQQLENADSQNQTDQQQLNSAGSNAGVDYSSQDSPIQP